MKLKQIGIIFFALAPLMVHAQSADPATIAIGNSSTFAGTSTAAGFTGFPTQGSIAIGIGNPFTGSLNGPTVAISSGVAIGTSAQATGYQSDIAIGFGAKSTVGFGVAMGQTAHSGASGALALGLNTSSMGFRSVSIGPMSHTSVAATNGVALGASASAGSASSTAVGAFSSVTAANSVAIGTASSTSDNRANQVSFGSAGATRLLTNVTSGMQATDATNLGQLNAGLISANE